MSNPRMMARLAGGLALDLRSLGLFRIGCALMLLWDLAGRAGHLRDHYSSAGVLPLRDFLQLPSNWLGPSLYMGTDQAAVVGGLLTLNALAAAYLLLGWRTRLASVICLLFLLSIQYRNPLLSDGGDALLRCLLVWGVFLPWGAAFSLEGQGEVNKPVVSMATLALSLQVCQLFWFAFLHKSGPTWWHERTAVGLALGLSEFATPLGEWLRGMPKFTSALTPVVLGVEAVAPFFLLCAGRLRWLGILPLAALQLGLTLTLAIGPFNPIALLALVAFLPNSFWEARGGALQSWLEEKVGRLREKFPKAPPVVVGSDPIWRSMLVAGLLLMVAGNNLAQWQRGRETPPWLFNLRVWTGLHQEWSMFSPDPPRQDVWLVAGGELADGRAVDLTTEGPLILGAPKPRLPAVLDTRQRRCLSSLGNPGMESFRRLYLEGISEQWKRRHPEQPLTRATLYRLSRPNDGVSAPERQALVSFP